MFSKQNGDRLEDMLLDRSFAFNFHSSEGYLMSETTGIKETGQVTKVTLCKDFLPKHCKLELVEDALASLARVPNNVQLLKTFADYVENSPSEHKGYFLMSGIKWGVFIACMIADLPLVLSLSVCALVISSLCYDNYLEKKLGKWIGENLIEDPCLVEKSSVNLAKMEANLIMLIGNCKTVENRGEASYKEMQLAMTNPSAPPHAFFSHYSNRVTEHQGATHNANDNVWESSKCLY